MDSAIVVALITGGCTVVGVVITSMATVRKTESQIKTSQAVTETKLEALAAEVRTQNSFALRVPAIEEHLKSIDQDLAEIKQDLKRAGG